MAEATVRTVLMTADAVGGVWTYALTLAGALAERGVRTVLAVMGPEPSLEQRAAALDIPGLALEARPFRLEWMSDPWEDVARAGDWLLGLESQHRPDVVQVNGYAHGALPFRAPTLLVAHSCVATWFRAVKKAELPASFAEYRRAVATGLAVVQRVVAPTRAMLSALRSEYGEIARASVIPNGIDGARSGHPAAKVGTVTAAGRLWDEAKNVTALDGIAGSLAWPVRIAGQATSPEGVTFRARTATLLGLLEPGAMRQELERASIFAHPARYEPFGLSVLEAARAGCALVLGDIATLREIWGHAALYAPPDDHRALRVAIQRLIADERLRAVMGQRASLRAASYTAERMGRMYLGCYRELLEQAPTALAPLASSGAR